MAYCIFCKIAAGEIPSECLYEDEYVYAFSDIAPQAPVHFLVIPKKHIASAGEVYTENSMYVAKCFETITLLAERLQLQEGFRVISNCGTQAGQTVFHLHFHVLAGVDMGQMLR